MLKYDIFGTWKNNMIMRNLINAMTQRFCSLIVVFCSNVFCACTGLDGDDGINPSADSSTSNTAVGGLGERVPLTVYAPDQKAYVNLFQKTEFHSILNVDGKNCLHVIYAIPKGSEGSVPIIEPLPEMTTWDLSIEVPRNSNLEAGKSLNLVQSQLAWMASSNSNDYQNHIQNGAGLIIREVHNDYIDVYVDHLMYSFNGFHIKNGDYYIYGDITIDRSWFNE